jgi:ABC-type nitrate/sulfonate/bicarbonate transport system permease component
MWAFATNQPFAAVIIAFIIFLAVFVIMAGLESISANLAEAARYLNLSRDGRQLIRAKR